MKKSRIYLIIVVVLILVAVTLVITKSSQNTMGDEGDFRISDTSNVTKVFLADKNNNTTLLTKNEDGTWTVNEKFKASSYAINMLLKTAMSVEIKAPVAKEAHTNVVKTLASSSTKVEIYQTAYRIDLWNKIQWFPYEKLTRVYYVGSATQDNMGTFFLMDGSEVPYIVYIPGFNGYLSTRYSPLEMDWRDHAIFNYKYKDIKSLTLEFPEFPEQSFKVIKEGNRDFKLFGIAGPGGKITIPVPAFDTLKVMDYFSAFQDIRFESLLDQVEQKIRDSIINSVPFHILTIEGVDGKLNTIKTFHKKGAPDQLDLENKPILWDRDRLFGLINDGKDLVLIQFYVFDPILQPLQYYLPAPPVAETK